MRRWYHHGRPGLSPFVRKDDNKRVWLNQIPSMHPATRIERWLPPARRMELINKAAGTTLMLKMEFIISKCLHALTHTQRTLFANIFSRKNIFCRMMAHMEVRLLCDSHFFLFIRCVCFFVLVSNMFRAVEGWKNVYCEVFGEATTKNGAAFISSAKNLQFACLWI